MFLDIFVLVIFFISALIAFLRGFIREALALVSLGLALAAGYFFGPFLEPVVGGWFGLQPGAEDPGKLFGLLPLDIVVQIVSHGGVFLFVILALSLLTHFLAEFIKSIGLGAIDRSLGVVFGLLRAAVVVVVLYLPIHMLVEQETKEKWFEHSKTHFYVEKGAELLLKTLPGTVLEKKIDKTEENLSQNKAILTAREKLQSMDLLREDLTPEERAKLVKEKFDNGELQKVFEGEGYSEEFRETIDQLFKQNVEGGVNE